MDTRRLAALASILIAFCIGTAPLGAEELAELDFSELQYITVTSVSRKEERLFDVAAPITVLSNDDLRRSGATSVADALRMVPGMGVFTTNSSRWGLSTRGFANMFANKLLVLVDGRAVYSPLFAGVLWYLQQPMLEDVDRIEIIRGPGATVWGANAVNGVINIVTRNAKETQGLLAFAGGGNVVETTGGLRFGGRRGKDTSYRVFAEHQSQDDFPLSDGTPAGDAWERTHAGFRVDSERPHDTHLTWQADTSRARLDHGASDAYNVNTLGRWSRKLSARSSVEVQAYYDRTHVNEALLSINTAETLDLSFQHSSAAWERHEVTWGAGYRYVHDEVAPTLYEVRDASVDTQLFSTFIQDELTVVPDRLTLIAGTKLEHNDFTGFEIQPSIKGVFKPTSRQTVWAAISRAVRTPSEIEGRDLVTLTIGPPFQAEDGGWYLPTIVGNADLDSEVLKAYELGYRTQLGARASLDVSTFYNDYSGLTSFGAVSRLVPGQPFGIAEIPWVNALDDTAHGGEVELTVAPLDFWRLTASYSLLRFAESSGDPEQQASLRSFHDFASRMSVDAQLRYVAGARYLDVSNVTGFVSLPARVTADVRLSYRPTRQLELSLAGTNLLDEQHAEQGPGITGQTVETPRGIYGKVTWRN